MMTEDIGTDNWETGRRFLGWQELLESQHELRRTNSCTTNVLDFVNVNNKKREMDRCIVFSQTARWPLIQQNAMRMVLESSEKS